MECNGGIPWNTTHFWTGPVFFVLSSIVEIGKTTHLLRLCRDGGCADVN